MTRQELKAWAKEKVQGKRLILFAAIIVTGILESLTIGQKVITNAEGHYEVTGGIPLGIFFGFVSVGLVSYVVKFINDQDCQFNELFAYAKDFVRILVVNLLRGIFVFLFTLLLIVPGIIKMFAYTMVDMILADSKYDNLGFKEVLDLSEKMMKGHKMDYFVLNLSFVGWHFLAAFTLGILEIWILPYQQVASTKFLYDVKKAYEKENGEEEKPVKKAKKEEE